MEGGAHNNEDAQRRVDLALAEAALGLYGLRGARVVRLRSGFTQVFRVDSPDSGRFVLRLYNLPRAVEEAERSGRRFHLGPGLRSPETLHAQLLWLSALARETDLTVPTPVTTLGNSLVGHVSLRDALSRGTLLRRALGRYLGKPRPGDEQRHCALLRWVPGQQKRQAVNPADASSLGSFVARLHEHAEAYEVPDPGVLPHWDWHWPFGESAQLWDAGANFYSDAGMAVFEETARRVSLDLGALGRDEDVFGMIHRDLKLENLLFREAGTVGAIDFDMSGMGHYLLDLTVAIHVLERKGARGAQRRPGELREALLEGYERTRRLPDDYPHYLGTFAAMRRVNAVNRELGRLAAGSATSQRAPAANEHLLRASVGWLERTYLEGRAADEDRRLCEEGT